MPVTGGQAGAAFPAPIEFVGSVRSRPFGFGISAPLSHLTIDGDSLLVSGPGRLHRLTRADVATVRLRIRVVGCRVDFVLRDGNRPDFYFAAMARSAIRNALKERGWPVEG